MRRACTLQRHCEEQRDDPPSLAARAMAGLESAEALLRVGGSNPDCRCGDRLDCFACARNDGATQWLLRTYSVMLPAMQPGTSPPIQIASPPSPPSPRPP